MKRLPLLALILLLLVPACQASIVDDVTDLFGFLVNPEDYKVTSHDFSGKKNYSYSASEGNIIFRVYHDVDPGTTINETYYYGSRSIDVDLKYDHSWFTSTYYFTLSNETTEVNGSYSQYALFPGTKTFVVTYTMDDEGLTGLSAYVDSGVLKPGLKIQAEYLEQSPITKVVGTSTNYIDLTIETVTYAGFQESREETEEIVNAKDPFAWLSQALEIWATVSIIFFSLFWILKLIFVDNIFLTFMFFESFALIYSLQAKDIMSWWKRIIHFHKEFIMFLVSFVDTLIGIFYKIALIVLKIIKPTG